MEQQEGLCYRVREEGLLIRLIDGELNQTEEHSVLTHLRVCPDCLSLASSVFYMDSRIQEIFEAQTSAEISEQKEKQKTESSSAGFRLEIDKLPVGKSLDRDLLDDNGNLLIAAGTELTPGIITSLRNRGIEKLTIRQPEVEAVPEKPVEYAVPQFNVKDFREIIEEAGIEPAISEHVRHQAIETIRESFKNLESEGVFDFTSADEIALDVTNEVLQRQQVALTLADLELYDQNLYTHSVNVLVLFLLTARAMGHPAQLIRDHATAVLLHDIGRIVLRRSDIAAGRKRTMEEEDLEHTEAGYTYLWNLGGIKDTALRMVMNHHERYDGQGYPRGLKGTNLSDWDQLLILTNTFDNLSWDRKSSVRTGFHEALSVLIQESGKYVRKGIIRAVIQTLGHYPPGSFVRLNTGEVGVVTKAHPGSPLKPMVSLLYDPQGRKLSKRKQIDLSYLSNAYIQGDAKVDLLR